MSAPGAATELVTTDFETYYADDYTLSKMTIESYIRDPRFEVIGVGVKVGDAAACWMEGEEFRAWTKLRDWGKTAALAHNAHFEGLILSHHFGVAPALWVDTLSMHNAVHHVTEVGGSLAKLMAHYGVGVKGDEVLRARGKRRRDFTEDEWLRYGDYCRNDCNGTYAIFQKMASGFPDLEAYVVDATIRMFTEPVVMLDTDKLRPALADEQKRKADLMAQAETDRATLMSNEKFAVLLTSLGVDPPRKISPTTGLETWAFAKADPGMKDLLEHPDDEVRWLAEARAGVKSTIAESRISRFLDLSTRGPAPVFLKYAAAHTQRWGGGDKTNFQNLPRKGPLRDALVAPKGHVFVVVDSAQIEARGLAWISGNQAVLDAFRNGRDVYSEFASEAYGRPIDRKKNPEDEIPGFVGKVCVLGLGYGMGWQKFAATMLAGALGGPPVQFGQKEVDLLGVDVAGFAARFGPRVESLPSRLDYGPRLVHCAVAEAFVTRYRRINAPVPQFWRLMDRVIQCMDDGTRYVFPWDDGPFTAERHAILRPSGLRLRYPGLRGGEDGHSYLGGRVGKERSKVYGGLLTENIVQAFCRDIVAEQMVRLRREHGYRPAMMTHDDLAFCVPAAHAAETLRTVLEAMKTPPEWCLDLPLGAEGGFAERYGDA